MLFIDPMITSLIKYSYSFQVKHLDIYQKMTCLVQNFHHVQIFGVNHAPVLCGLCALYCKGSIFSLSVQSANSHTKRYRPCK